MNERTKIMVEMALAVALSAVLNFLPLWKMPQGGSVSLEMLPIFIVALRRGVGPGMITGFVYGLLQLAFDPYILHPVQVLLDYPLPYMFLGLAGIFRGKVSTQKKANYTYLFIALLLGGLTRLLFHILSGVIFFAQYAPEGQNVWVYSAVYNGSYLLPALLLCLLIIVPLARNLLNPELIK